MMYESLSDAQLLQEIQDTRAALNRYQEQLDQEDNSVDRGAMRGEMTKLNHLKVEANRRGLPNA